MKENLDGENDNVQPKDGRQPGRMADVDLGGTDISNES